MSVQYPPNETERLHVLQQYEILDTPTEPAFDRITRLTARLLDGSTASINFVDGDRQWTKSCSNNNVPSSIPRDVSFCAHAILADTPLIVPDTLDDPRFADNPFVTAAHGIRFYAGTPLRTSEGVSLGTLCIVDSVPRLLDEAHITTLTDLAALATDELELRRANLNMRAEIKQRERTELALHASEQQYRLLFDSNPQPMWVYDPQTLRFLAVNDAAAIQYGYSREEFLALTLLDIQPETDHAQLWQASSQATAVAASPNVWRHAKKNGETVWVEISSHAIQFQAHSAMLVLAQNITQHKQAEEALQTSESKLHMIMAQTPTVLWTCDSNLRLTSSIGGGLARLKLEPEASNGATLQEIFAQSAAGTKVLTAHRQALRGESTGYEIMIGPWYYDVRVEPLRDNKHEIIGCIGLAIDITERKHAESWLRASEERYRTLAETAIDAIYTISADGLISSLNAAFERITGWSCDEWLGRHFSEIIHPGDVHAAMKIFRQTLAGETIAPFELPLLCKNGNYLVCELTATRQIQGDAVVGVLGIARDVTARKHAEQAMYDSNARLQAIFNSEPECVKLVAADGTLLEMNSAGLAMIEADSAEQVLGRSIYDLIHPDDRVDYEQRLNAVANGESVVLQFRVIGLQGGLHWMESSSVPLRDHIGTITAVLSITRDITARKAADEALADAYARLSTLSAQIRQGRDLLRTLFDGLDDGMLLVGSSGNILAVNQALATLLRLTPEALVGNIWPEICMTPSIGFPGAVVVQTLYDGRARRRRERFTTPDNHHYILDLQTLPLMNAEQTVDQVILHVANVTERVQMEALVMQNERLAATGKLAATMAHEINTPLQSIRSCLYLAGKTADTQREKYLSLAREEIDRISGILRHLLDLHRPGSGTFVPIDLTELVERVLLLTSGTMAERSIELERDLSRELPPLYGRIDQLTQVLLNLTLNALESMAEGGTVRFVTRAVKGDNGRDTHLVLEITDSGHGMSIETQSHIFEPFFTTKPGGTGIGLAVSQKIIAQHKGVISVHSVPSVGSTFTITFELSERPAANQDDKV